MNRDDTLWKAILEDIFDDFLRFFIPDADALFDMQRGFVFLDKELEQLFPPEADAYDNRSVDKLVQVYTRQGTEQWILVHIEVQGRAERAFAQRMFTYFARIFDKYHRPITAFALLTDESHSFRPTEYSQELLGTSLIYRFNTYKVLDQSAEELARSDNPFAAVALVVHAALQKRRLDEEALLTLKLDIAKALLAKPFTKVKVRQLMNFLRYYVRFKDKSLNVNFDRAVDTFTNRQQTMGLEEFLLQRATIEGRQEGEQRKGYTVVVNMIRQTAFSDSQIADLADVSVEFVQSVRRELAH